MEPDPLILAAYHERDPGSALRHSGGERPVWDNLWGLQMLWMLWGEQLMFFFHYFVY